MSKLHNKAHEVVTGLADLGSEMENKINSFEATTIAIDLVNDASCFIQRQDEEIKRLREVLNEIKVFSNDVREFNYPCDKIHSMACKGLGEKE